MRCIVDRAGRIGSRAKVNLAEVPLDLPSISSKDRQDLILAANEKVDLVIVSNTKTAATVQYVRDTLTSQLWISRVPNYKNLSFIYFAEYGGHDVKIIAKIETMHGVFNINEIIESADAVMIARSALSLSLPMEKVFLAQKSITAKCNKVIIAIQNLLPISINR